MPKWPLIGASYTSQSVNADCQSTINLYPEQIESGAGNNQIVLYPAPGTKSFVDLTPPAPPEVLNPDIYNSITIPLGGIQSGNDFVGTPFQPGPAAIVGDVALVAFYMLLVPNIHVPTSLDMTYLGTPIGTMTLVEAPLTFSSGVNLSALVLYRCNITLPFPAGAFIAFTAHFNGPTLGSDFRMSWSTIHNLTTFDQSSSSTQAGSTTFVAPPLTTALSEFVFSYCLLSLRHSEQAVLPFFKFTNDFLGAGDAYTIFNGFGQSFVAAPPGTYQPQWTSSGGTADSAIINAAFHLVPA